MCQALLAVSVRVNAVCINLDQCWNEKRSGPAYNIHLRETSGSDTLTSAERHTGDPRRSHDRLMVQVMMI